MPGILQPDAQFGVSALLLLPINLQGEPAIAEPLAAEFERIGYQAIWHGQKGFNGVAILARGDQPVEVRRGLEGEPEDEQSRYLEADVKGVRVASIYLPNGNPRLGPNFDYKLRWFERLIDPFAPDAGRQHTLAERASGVADHRGVTRSAGLPRQRCCLDVANL